MLEDEIYFFKGHFDHTFGFPLLMCAVSVRR